MENNVIFIGCTQNYGYEFSAANTKTELIARGLIESGDNCVIHNGIEGSKSVLKKTISTNKYSINIITYTLFINRYISWIFNIFTFCYDLKKIKRKGKKNLAILELPDYHIFLLYILVLRALQYKIGVISHEWGTTIETGHWIRKPSMWLFSKTFGYFVDFIFPISEFIIKRIEHFKKPFLKLPVIAEFEGKVSNMEFEKDNYFVYCVFAAYKRVILLIIDAFKLFCEIQNNKKLILVLSGTETQVSIINDYILKSKIENKIIIKRSIPYDELIKLYKRADALIIPLDPNNHQDEARFSQKIAEYLSAGCPIITNNVGEIKYYFTDRKNIVTVPYSITGFCNGFNWINNNNEEAKKIGESGYYLGLKYFDYKENGKIASKFLSII